ncbi:MAG: mechanosensitive ion channel [Chloroflexi bacterium]|nr:mechanosensitive ion channel [Chloroflexota bacterium]
MNFEPLNGWLTDLQAGGWIEAQALVVVVVAYVSARLVMNWSTRAMRRARVDLGTQILVKRALVVGWILVTLLWVLGILGVNPTGLVAVAGAFAVAFSLAIQDILKNFFSGIYLLLERPFRVGDTIRIKDQTGVVENIGVRTTQLRTVDNVQVLVPNATVFSEVVANQTYARPAAPPADGQSEADQAKTHA